MKRLTLDDLFSLETIGEMALSPDERSVAFVVQRSKNTTQTHFRHYLVKDDRADIFLGSMVTGETRNLTNGLKDDVGYWKPIWSPDGNRLVMLSTKGENLTLWVWERASDQIKPLTTRSVNVKDYNVPVIWLSNDTVACSVLPEGEQPGVMDIEIRTPQIAMCEWPKAWGGKQATASVLESPPVPINQRPQGQLMKINVETGEQHLITTGIIRYLCPSPNRAHFAFLRQVEPLLPRPGVPFQRDFETPEGYTLGIVSDAGERVIDYEAQIRDVTTDSIQWSNDSETLVLIAHHPNDDQSTIFEIQPKDGTMNLISDEAKKPIALTWSPSNELLVLAEAKEDHKDSTHHRREWWRIADNEYRLNLTKDIAAVPRKLFSHKPSQSLVGLAGGRLWTIQPQLATAEPLETVPSIPKIDAISWNRFNRGKGELIVKCGNRDAPELYHLRLSSEGNNACVQPIEAPGLERTFVNASSETRRLIFRSSVRDTTGLSVWLSGFGEDCSSQKIFQTNTFLKDIAHAQLRQIEYESLDGKPLRGWVILPIDYQQGKQYPLVSWVYAGRVWPDRVPPIASMYTYPAFNLQLFAAKGFAVLLPSIPLAPYGQVDDPLPKLVNGVLPAVDCAIDIGIADANRLAIIGHSFGGYTVYGLVTQTNRFHAAVALSGMSNLTSHYGAFDARHRYDTFPHEHNPALFIVESRHQRMGNPPWRDPERYIRNSPLFHAEHVTTPVMIIQGDLDYDDIQQGEEFFTALYRENKKGRFVRYWGEAHTIQSPANIGDMWERIFDWLNSCFASPMCQSTSRGTREERTDEMVKG